MTTDEYKERAEDEKQREIDTNNGWTVLFPGRYFNERKTPWYYIPLYILSASGSLPDLVIQLNEDHRLRSIELFPFDHLAGIPDLRLLTSEDGVEWTPVPYTKGGGNGLIFDTTVKNYLRLQCDAADFGIREILLYGY